MASADEIERIRAALDTSQIKHWRSIITLIVFVMTSKYCGTDNGTAILMRRADINVLFPFTVPVYVPSALMRAFSKTLAALRIAAPNDSNTNGNGNSAFVRLSFPMNFVTAPLIANLFLLAILAIGRTEVHDGIIGANNIAPYDIMIFFLSLAYIALSIDASGLIRYLAYRVLKSGGNAGHRLYFSLYSFFFVLTAAIGNDPIILSGTPFLAYLVS
jgi:DMSO reductase anchor subunit